MKRAVTQPTMFNFCWLEKNARQAGRFLLRDDAFDAFVSNLTEGGTKSKEFMKLVEQEGRETADDMTNLTALSTVHSMIFNITDV